MRVTDVRVSDFRNYERAELGLGPGLTVIHGENGAGKTNLLEAIYLGCTGRSCRTSSEREVVRIGSKVGRVELAVAADDGSHLIEVGLQPGEQKVVRFDGAHADRLAPTQARPLVSVFMPDRLTLVKGAPAPRRAHLDQVVAALWPARAQTRAAYTQTLAQRNALIARIRTHSLAPELLAPWDAELARHGLELMDNRRAAVEQIDPVCRALSVALELEGGLELHYRPRSRAQTAEQLRVELVERRGEDLARGFTAHGPHRDDLALVHRGRSLRSYGSQGQQRLGLLALLLAERDVLGRGGSPPLMLLDDVMSELDGSRRRRLAELVRSGGQAVITSTDADHVPGAHDSGVLLVEVASGTIAESLPAGVAGGTVAESLPAEVAT